MSTDGIATGSRLRAALGALRQIKPAHIVIAFPVPPASTCDGLRSEAGDLVCLQTPEPFYGVGQFYFDYSQLSDAEVSDFLDRATREMENPKYAAAEVAATEN